jgi:serine/threonine protein phosphatase PrpC
MASFDFGMTFEAAQDLGNTRDRNEDAFLADPELALFAVADGMGGHAAGEVAARLAIDEVHAALSSPESQEALETYAAKPSLPTRRLVLNQLRSAVEAANARVRSHAEQSPEQRGMGTTLDVVWLARSHAFVAHVGDSRVYLARPSAVLQLTHDHSEVEWLRSTGHLRPKGRVNRPDRLLNAIGVRDNVSVDTLYVDLSPGDRLLLCTDGIHGQLGTENELSKLLRQGGVADAASALVRAVATQGRDNATAVVIEIGERLSEPPSADQAVRAADVDRAALSPLLVDLSPAHVMQALAAAVEVELEPGTSIPQVFASDMVSYIVIDGVVRHGERVMSVGALLFAESLVDVWASGPVPVVQQRARLLRLRSHDFSEVCNADPALAAELYRRLATHLARIRVRSQPPQGSPE